MSRGFANDPRDWVQSQVESYQGLKKKKMVLDAALLNIQHYKERLGLVSLFNGISTLFRLFNAKAILLEEQYYLTHSYEDKGVHTFPKGICPKVNIKARLENELAYYDSAVHRCNHYTTRTPPYKERIKVKWSNPGKGVVPSSTPW